MDYKKLPIGKNPPDVVNVVIEIPLGGEPVKYEFDKESGAIFVDRFLHTAMYYPGNYGFIPHTLSGDGDPVDVLVVGRVPVIPGAVMAVRPIGVIFMEDEGGKDEKIIAAPAQKLSYFADVKTYEDLPPIYCEQISHFFKHYKDLEKDKWVTIARWGTPDEAKKLILDGIQNAKDKAAK